MFQGLLTSDGSPVFPSGIKISTNVERTHNSRVNTSPLVIVELRLSTIPKFGSLTRVLEAALEGHFAPNPANFLVKSIEFNVMDVSDVHLNRMKKMVTNLLTYVPPFLHSSRPLTVL